MDGEPVSFDEESGVKALYGLLMEADRVNITVGTAQNPAAEHVSFRQRGITPRRRVVDLLAQRLEEAGKLVVIDHV